MTTNASLPTAPEPSLPGPSPLGTAANPRPRAALALLGWLALCYAVAALGSQATVAAIPTWYAALVKPPLTPPNWLFAPVWTLLYTAMAVAAWLGWRTRRSTCRNRGTRLFLVQLLLNLTWTWLFFSQHRPGLALIEIGLLWAAIALTARTFFTISRRAGWLMVPYFVWVTFAAYLNWGIWRLNP
jgi:tryptophan-rich sensory protein